MSNQKTSCTPGAVTIYRRRARGKKISDISSSIYQGLEYCRVIMGRGADEYQRSVLAMYVLDTLVLAAKNSQNEQDRNQKVGAIANIIEMLSDFQLADGGVELMLRAALVYELERSTTSPGLCHPEAGASSNAQERHERYEPSVSRKLALTGTFTYGGVELDFDIENSCREIAAIEGDVATLRHAGDVAAARGARDALRSTILHLSSIPPATPREFTCKSMALLARSDRSGLSKVGAAMIRAALDHDEGALDQRFRNL